MPTQTRLKQNDTGPAFAATLRDAEGTPINLQGATVRFVMRDAKSRVVKVDAVAEVTDATGGRIRYAWTSTDLDRFGHYDAEIEVTFSDLVVETFPSAGYHRIVVDEDVDRGATPPFPPPPTPVNYERTISDSLDTTDLALGVFPIEAEASDTISISDGGTAELIDLFSTISLSFSSFARIPSTAGFDVGRYSIGLWVKGKDSAPAPSEAPIFEIGDSAGSDVELLIKLTVTGEIEVVATQDGDPTLPGERAIVRSTTQVRFDNTWHLLVVELDKNAPIDQLLLWVDGVNETTVIESIGPPLYSHIAGIATFGESAFAPDRLVANLDEFSFFGDDFDPSDVAALWNGGQPGNLEDHPKFPVLVSWYRFGELAGGDIDNMPDAIRAGATYVLETSGLLSTDFQTDVPVAPDLLSPVIEETAIAVSDSVATEGGSPSAYSTVSTRFEDHSGAERMAVNGSGIFGAPDLSVSIWVKSVAGAAPPSDDVVLWQLGDLPTVQLEAEIRLIDTGEIQVFLSRDGTRTLSAGLMSRSTTRIRNDGTWHLIAFAANKSGVLTIYLDGVPNSTPIYTNSVSAIGAGNMTIGGSPDQPEQFTGMIDEVCCWHHLLDAGEIAEIWNAGKPANLDLHSRATRRRSWYRMGEDASDINTIADLISPRNTPVYNLAPVGSMTNADLVSDTP